MTIDTFKTRNKCGEEKEKSDASTLQGFGCETYPSGLGLLPDEIRKYLHAYPLLLLLRWFPDLVAVRPDLQPTRRVNLHVDRTEGLRRAKERNYIKSIYLPPDIAEYMWLVDSKYTPPEKRERYSNWLLEQDTLTAHRLIRQLGLPIVYIWPDGCTCSYVEDLKDDILKPAPYRGEGSGTPSWLVPKKITLPLKDVFGKGIA